MRVSAAVFLRGSTVLLTERPPGGPYASFLQFPGGRARQHEANIDVLKREAQEELGVEVKRARLLIVTSHNLTGADQTVISFYLVEEYGGELTPLEGQRLLWYDLDSRRPDSIMAPTATVLDSLARDPLVSCWDVIWEANNLEFSSGPVRRRRAKRKIDALVQLNFHIEPFDRVADIGCGTGEVSLEAFDHFECGELYCIDSSLGALRKLQSHLRRPLPLSVVQADAVQIPVPDEYFSTVLLLGVLEHVHSSDRLLSEIHRVLQPNGRVFIAQSNARSVFLIDRLIRQLRGRWPYGYQKNMSPPTLTRLIAKNFEVEGISVRLHGIDAPWWSALDTVMHRWCASWGRTVFVSARRL